MFNYNHYFSNFYSCKLNFLYFRFRVVRRRLNIFNVSRIENISNIKNKLYCLQKNKEILGANALFFVYVKNILGCLVNLEHNHD
jgi:hypothetical protein